jgi:hypothetical protein
MKHEFDAVLQRLEGKIAWTVFYVPFSVFDIYGTNGRLNIIGIVDGYNFTGTLLPSKNGHYCVFNQTLKDNCKKGIGDTIHIMFEEDTTLRTVEIPQEILNILNFYPQLLDIFQRLPDYIKKEEINKILGAKKQETRDKRIQALIEKLSSMDAK